MNKTARNFRINHNIYETFKILYIPEPCMECTAASLRHISVWPAAIRNALVWHVSVCIHQHFGLRPLGTLNIPTSLLWTLIPSCLPMPARAYTTPYRIRNLGCLYMANNNKIYYWFSFLFTSNVFFFCFLLVCKQLRNKYSSHFLCEKKCN